MGITTYYRYMLSLCVTASKQGDRPFSEWAYKMQTRNALLRGRMYHFSDKTFRETLENNMDSGLELQVRRMVAEGEALTPL